MSKAKKFAEHAIRIEPAEVYDNAIVGISKDKLLIYSHERIMQILMHYESMDYDDALDWAGYNIYSVINEEKPQFKVSYALRYRIKSQKAIRDICLGRRDYHPRYR